MKTKTTPRAFIFPLALAGCTFTFYEVEPVLEAQPPGETGVDLVYRLPRADVTATVEVKTKKQTRGKWTCYNARLGLPRDEFGEKACKPRSKAAKNVAFEKLAPILTDCAELEQMNDSGKKATRNERQRERSATCTALAQLETYGQIQAHVKKPNEEQELGENAEVDAIAISGGALQIPKKLKSESKTMIGSVSLAVVAKADPLNTYVIHPHQEDRGLSDRGLSFKFTSDARLSSGSSKASDQTGKLIAASIGTVAKVSTAAVSGAAARQLPATKSFDDPGAPELTGCDALPPASQEPEREAICKAYTELIALKDARSRLLGEGTKPDVEGDQIVKRLAALDATIAELRKNFFTTTTATSKSLVVEFEPLAGCRDYRLEGGRIVEVEAGSSSAIGLSICTEGLPLLAIENGNGDEATERRKQLLRQARYGHARRSVALSELLTTLNKELEDLEKKPRNESEEDRKKREKKIEKKNATIASVTQEKEQHDEDEKELEALLGSSHFPFHDADEKPECDPTRRAGVEGAECGPANSGIVYVVPASAQVVAYRGGLTKGVPVAQTPILLPQFGEKFSLPNSVRRARTGSLVVELDAQTGMLRSITFEKTADFSDIATAAGTAAELVGNAVVELEKARTEASEAAKDDDVEALENEVKRLELQRQIACYEELGTNCPDASAGDGGDDSGAE